jgi:hypothetical protein
LFWTVPASELDLADAWSDLPTSASISRTRRYGAGQPIGRPVYSAVFDPVFVDEYALKMIV